MANENNKRFMTDERKRRDVVVMKLYKVGHPLHKRGVPLVPGLITRAIRVLFACDLPMSAELGEGCILMHNGLGVAIHPRAVIGKNAVIHHHVSIGGRNERGVPVIGDNCHIGCGASILGGIEIGDNVTIGANTLVIDDVPDNSTVVGAKGRVLVPRQTEASPKHH